MLARILFRTPARVPRPLARAALLLIVLIVPSLSLSAARAVPLAHDGAPVCVAPGDQRALFYSAWDCGNLQFGWIDSRTAADTLTRSSVGFIPPTGDCDTYLPRVDAPGVSEPSGAVVRSGLIAIAMPVWCVGPGPLAIVWKQGSGASSQLVLDNTNWLSHARVVVDDGDFGRQHPRLAGSGNVYQDTALVAVWSDERTGVPQIRAQRVNWNGQREWGSAGILIAPTGAAQTDPEITRLQDGGVIVAWLDARSGGSDVYALKLLSNGSVAPGWPATGLALEARPEVASAVRLAHQDGYLPDFVVWEETGARFGGGRSIVVRKLAEDGTPDPAWDPLGVVLSTSATVEHLQDVATSGDAVVAVWTDTRAASVSNPTDLYAQRVLVSGAIAGGWPATGLAICTANGRQGAARVSVGAIYSGTYAAFAWGRPPRRRRRHLRGAAVRERNAAGRSLGTERPPRHVGPR
jgi:hypothetical protein